MSMKDDLIELRAELVALEASLENRNSQMVAVRTQVFALCIQADLILKLIDANTVISALPKVPEDQQVPNVKELKK